MVSPSCYRDDREGRPRGAARCCSIPVAGAIVFLLHATGWGIGMISARVAFASAAAVIGAPAMAQSTDAGVVRAKRRHGGYPADQPVA
ncbi:hypothetical protein AB5I41_24855 [Sphingomonas sp. MMS24-JH45]